MAEHQIVIFSAGCRDSEQTIRLVRELVADRAPVDVVDGREPAVVSRMQALGIRWLPAVVVDGRLAICRRARAVVPRS